MEKQAVFFKKAKTWNMVQLVISGIFTVFSLFSIPSLINPANSIKTIKKTMELFDDPKMIATLEQSIELSLNPLYRIYSFVTIVISAALVVCYFLANRKLKQQINVSKVPYYIYMGTVVVSLIVTFAQGNFSIAGIALTVVPAIPVILVLVNLFKLDSDEE